MQLQIVKYQPCTVINQKRMENNVQHYLFRYLPLDFLFVTYLSPCRVVFRCQLLLCVYVSNVSLLSAWNLTRGGGIGPSMCRNSGYLAPTLTGTQNHTINETGDPANWAKWATSFKSLFSAPMSLPILCTMPHNPRVVLSDYIWEIQWKWGIANARYI